MKSRWHRDYEPFELAENMEEDLGRFEAATHVRHFEIEPPVVRNVLAATAAGGECLEFAKAAANRFAAEVVTESSATTAAAILASGARCGAGLIVVSGAVGSEVLAGLVTGDGMHDPPALAVVSRSGPAALDSLVVPLFEDKPAARLGLAWACSLAASAGPRGLVSAVELSTPATRQEARRLAGNTSSPEEVRQATVGRTVSSHLGSLVAALQRNALSKGYAVDVSFRPGWPRREILSVLSSLAHPATVILGRDGLPATQGHGPAFRLALELVEERAEAVLIV
jgi:hypothetical protein